MDDFITSLRKIIESDDATQTERDAATELVQRRVADAELLGICKGYFDRQLRQDRYGK